MEPVTLLVAVAAALAVLLIFIGLASGAEVNVRLERYASAPQAESEAKRKQNLGELIASSAAMANLNRVVERRDWGANLARELARADIALKPSEFLALRLAALLGIPLAMVGLSPLVGALGNPIAWALGLIAGFFLPRIWLGRRKSKRLKAFNSNLADTITLLANALRAGSSFLQGLEMVVRETQPPMSTEFERVIREVNLGLPMEQALANMTRRVRSDDLDLMTTAISIQYQVGGNLAEILDTIAFTIRERVRIKGEIRSLTAQGRLSGYVVGFLPVALVGVLSVISPTFMAPMFQKPPAMFGLPMGMVILMLGGVMMVIGFFMIRRIVDIEV
ncbi:MAG TPA: type II secretion system F family protein [Candidatus Caenarcaniphilales bacterium]|nr:type II secretion system F family protein [Candidatus Caenarcaniphilales bacterium]